MDTDKDPQLDVMIPRGISILGGINVGLFGLLFAVNWFLYIALTFHPQLFNVIVEALKNSTIKATVTYTTVKLAIVVQMLICLLYIVSGVGLLKRKHWGRKFTVYFASCYALILFILTVLQPSIVRYTLFRLIYPGILIWYFTNSKVIRLFS